MCSPILLFLIICLFQISTYSKFFNKYLKLCENKTSIPFCTFLKKLNLNLIKNFLVFFSNIASIFFFKIGFLKKKYLNIFFLNQFLYTDTRLILRTRRYQFKIEKYFFNKINLDTREYKKLNELKNHHYLE